MIACCLAWRGYASDPRLAGLHDIVDSEANGEQALPASAIQSRTPFPVTIRKANGPPRVATGIADADGQQVTAACSACHTARLPNHENRAATDLNEFHRGMSFSHGTMTCLSCHDANDYDSLQLADHSQLAFEEVMTLCSQCHATQRRDYDHGAHGGMNGYWDLSRGPRLRNNCVDCHHPHQPQFPKMQPTFKPRDRFLDPHSEAYHEDR